MSGNILNEYIALLDRRKVSALWRAEQWILCHGERKFA